MTISTNAHFHVIIGHYTPTRPFLKIINSYLKVFFYIPKVSDIMMSYTGHETVSLVPYMITASSKAFLATQ